MAELTQQERLQPALLDRLTDDEPKKKEESRDQRVISMRRLRDAVIRDLGWLLNTANLTAVHDLSAYPEVASSVLNFGLPDLTGHSASGIDVAEMEALLRTAILRFEPRILRNTLTVRLVRDETKMSHNTMAFDIVGEVWGQPVPTRIYLKTEIDLEMNEVRVSDSLSTGGG